MTSRALVVGSGAGGSVAAMVLAAGGWDVTVLEKGPNYFTDLTSSHPGTVFSNDELKMDRFFSVADPGSEQRVFRSSPAAKPQVGAVQNLPQTVGGGTVHWDAKTPRYWDIDFRKLSLLGPVPSAAISDWPFGYGEIAPYYDAVEELIGVAGDVGQFPEQPTLAHAPRSRALPMPAGPPQYSSKLVAEGCTRVGLHPFIGPMAINSRPYQGRPACNNCGYCSGYGCPILARIGALAPLRRALIDGAELRDSATVVKITTSGRRATGVTWLDDRGRPHDEAADLAVVAASPIETVRLALLSQLPDPHGVTGRYLMFHWFSEGSGIFLSERLHNYRGRDHIHDIDDFADPDFPGARAPGQQPGLLDSVLPCRQGRARRDPAPARRGAHLPAAAATARPPQAVRSRLQEAHAREPAARPALWRRADRRGPAVRDEPGGPRPVGAGLPGSAGRPDHLWAGAA